MFDYEEKEKQRIENFLEAFQPYTKTRRGFDILRLPEGYFYVFRRGQKREKQFVLFSTDLLEGVFLAMAEDIVREFKNWDDYDQVMYRAVIEETGRRMTAVIGTMDEDRNMCLAWLEERMRHVLETESLSF